MLWVNKFSLVDHGEIGKRQVIQDRQLSGKTLMHSYPEKVGRQIRNHKSFHIKKFQEEVHDIFMGLAA